MEIFQIWYDMAHFVQSKQHNDNQLLGFKLVEVKFIHDTMISCSNSCLLLVSK